MQNRKTLARIGVFLLVMIAYSMAVILKGPTPEKLEQARTQKRPEMRLFF